jgi:hypothetical protein
MDINSEHHKLVPVHTCMNDEEGEIIIEFLAANDIEAILDSNLPHSLTPVEDDAQVLVHEDNAEEAKRLLSDREAYAGEEGKYVYDEQGERQEGEGEK